MTPVLNYDDMTVVTDGRREHLTPKEFDILDFLLRNPDCIFTSDEIYEEIWGCEPFETNSIIAVHLRHIREKIEKDPSKPRMIRSQWGRGYRYCTDGE